MARLKNITSNDDKDIGLADIDQQRPTTLNWTPQIKLLNKLSQNFKEIMFSEFKFLVNIPASNTRYPQSKNQNNNPFQLFNNKLHYV